MKRAQAPLATARSPLALIYESVEGRIMRRARQKRHADQDDVVRIDTAGPAQVRRPSVVRTSDRIDHGVGLLAAAIGDLRR